MIECRPTLITDSTTGVAVALVEHFADVEAADSATTDALKYSVTTGTPAFRMYATPCHHVSGGAAYCIRRIWPAPDPDWLMLTPEELPLYVRGVPGHVH